MMVEFTKFEEIVDNDNNSLIDLNDEENEKLLNDNNSIRQHLKVLQKPWMKVGKSLSSATDLGWFYKKKRSGGWSKHYFAVAGNQLYYFRKAESKSIQGSISVSFIGVMKDTSHDEMKEINDSKISSKCFDLFTPHRVVSMIAENDDVCKKFYTSLSNFIKNHMDPENFLARLEAAKAIQPLLLQKTEDVKEKLYALVALLDRNGLFFGSKLGRKEKGGNMELEEDDEWHSYYFTLLHGCLYFYKSSKMPPRGLILLANTSITNLTDDTTFHFQIENPITTFHLRCKNATALEDWLLALQNAKKFNVRDENEDETSEDEGFVDLNEMEMTELATPDTLRRQLVYRIGNREERKGSPKQKFILPNKAGIFVIGRSRGLPIHVDDPAMSREHAKIESKDGVSWYLMDLGSNKGTKVNHQKISSKVLLKPNDKIKVGRTRMRFRVKGPLPTEQNLLKKLSKLSFF